MTSQVTDAVSIHDKNTSVSVSHDRMTDQDISQLLEKVSPSDYVSTMQRDRPYDGQPHTDSGKRGKTLVEGLTFRDIRDCFIRGCFHSSGLQPSEWPSSVYDLPWSDMDIIAVSQNMSCEMERMMGIFPNIENESSINTHTKGTDTQ